jgi:hypothetical protein
MIFPLDTFYPGIKISPTILSVLFLPPRALALRQQNYPAAWYFCYHGEREEY